jgi:hypothetical protein
VPVASFVTLVTAKSFSNDGLARSRVRATRDHEVPTRELKVIQALRMARVCVHKMWSTKHYRRSSQRG